MTVIPFPNRQARDVRASIRAGHERRRAVMTNQRAAATLCKSGLTMWLMPGLFWLTVLDRMSTDDGAE